MTNQPNRYNQQNLSNSVIMTMLKKVDFDSKIAYNRGVIIRVANSLQRFFLLSKTNIIAIIQVARLGIGQTCKSVKSLATRPTTNRATFFIGPYTTEKPPIVGRQPYGGLSKGIEL